MSISFWADGGCRLSVQADSHPKSSGLVLGRRPLGAVLNSSNELGELLQWLCHDDSTINIVLDIIIIIKKVLLLEQNVRQLDVLPVAKSTVSGHLARRERTQTGIYSSHQYMAAKTAALKQSGMHNPCNRLIALV